MILSGHFYVFSTVTLFGLTEVETKRKKQFNTYLGTRDAKIAYQRHIHKKVLAEATKTIVRLSDKTTILNSTAENTSIKPTSSFIINEKSNSDEDVASSNEESLNEKVYDATTRPSVLDNIEINMAHVHPLEFQSSTSSRNF